MLYWLGFDIDWVMVLVQLCYIG